MWLVTPGGQAGHHYHPSPDTGVATLLRRELVFHWIIGPVQIARGANMLPKGPQGGVRCLPTPYPIPLGIQSCLLRS